MIGYRVVIAVPNNTQCEVNYIPFLSYQERHTIFEEWIGVQAMEKESEFTASRAFTYNQTSTPQTAQILLIYPSSHIPQNPNRTPNVEPT
jgi:hypothetical protein